jgi:hypothetical protein
MNRKPQSGFYHGTIYPIIKEQYVLYTKTFKVIENNSIHPLPKRRGILEF